MRLAWIALVGLALSVGAGGCAVFTRSEADQMQTDIRDIKLQINQLKQMIGDDDKKMLYSLMEIEEKLDIRQESLGTALRDVDARLADVKETVGAISSQPPSRQGVKSAPSPSTAQPLTDRGLEPPSNPQAGVAPSTTDNPSMAGGNAEQVFYEGTMAWQSKDIDRAEKFFRQFYQQWPTHPKASDALFFVGDCHYTKGEFPQAIASYQDVLNNYPGSQMEAEASAKVGYCYYNMKDLPRAREALQRTVDRYPNYGQIDKVKEVLATLQ